jgi:hypothetical protein
MSGTQGRFQSPDPGNAGAQLGEPQTWNGYSYVVNNPLTYTDPSGLGFWSTLWNGTIWIGEHVLPALATKGVNQLWGGGWPGIGGSGGPWSEQLPAGVGVGGTLNTGTVFGSGDAGPFINNFADGQAALSNAADVIAGIGDTISFGFSAWFRRKMAGKDPRSCNGYYRTGSWIGVGLSMATGVAGGLENAGAAGAGKEFSHWIPARLGGPRTVLNGNYVSVAEHALSDPSRYRFMPRVWKEANPLPGAVTQQLNRVPSVLTGTGIGAAWSAIGRFLGGACGGN